MSRAGGMTGEADMFDDTDINAIRRAHDSGGRAASMAELRRRFIPIPDADAEKLLDRVLMGHKPRANAA